MSIILWFLAICALVVLVAFAATGVAMILSYSATVRRHRERRRELRKNGF